MVSKIRERARADRWIIGLLVAAGIIYNSWPLGYWLNAKVGHVGMASELQATGQPYNWLFVLLDVVSGGLVLLGGWLLVQAHWRRMDWKLKVSLMVLGVFAVTTILAALLPMSCVPTIKLCTDLDRDPIYQAHGGISILSGIATVISVLITASKSHFKFWHGALWLSLVGLAGIAAFAVVVQLMQISGNVLQYSFILYSGAWVALFPYVVLHSIHTQLPSRHKGKLRQKTKRKVMRSSRRFA